MIVGEDQPFVREGIVHVLQDAGFEVAGAAADARALVRMARMNSPDVVIADIQMPPITLMTGCGRHFRSVPPSRAQACWCYLSSLRTATSSTWPTALKGSATC